MARAQARPVRARGRSRRRARRRHLRRGGRDARAGDRGGLRRGGPAAREPVGARALARRSPPSSRRSPACPPATATRGALVVAADRDDAEALRRLHELPALARARVRVAHARRAAARSSRASRRASPAASSRRRTAAPTRARRCARSPRRRSEVELGVEVRGDRARRLGGDRRAHDAPGRSRADQVVVAAGPVERGARAGRRRAAGAAR